MNVLEQRSTGQHTHFDFAAGADGERPLQEKPEVSDAVLRQRAAALVAVWEITVPTKAQTCLTQRLERLAARLRAFHSAFAEGCGAGRGGWTLCGLVR